MGEVSEVGELAAHAGRRAAAARRRVGRLLVRVAAMTLESQQTPTLLELRRPASPTGLAPARGRVHLRIRLAGRGSQPRTGGALWIETAKVALHAGGRAGEDRRGPPKTAAARL